MRLLKRDTLLLGLFAATLICACSDDGNTDKTTSDAAVVVDDAGAGSCDEGDDDVGATDEKDPAHDGDTDTKILPIVFVHGFAGSASQFDSQAQRFIANGYPPSKLFAYDHDGAGLNVAAYTDGLDAVIEGARTKFNTTQVYLIGHSRGTLVSNTYLGNPERAKKVAKVILLDGSTCMVDGIPCDAPHQVDFPGQKHVEVATSEESFKRQYKFLLGKEPTVSGIVKEASRVTISGRAVNFPANTGRDGATLRVYEVNPDTGERLCDKEIASFDIAADGEWGPLKVNPDARYEMSLTSAEDGAAVQHFYFQKFLRSTKFVRLLSGPPDSPSRLNSNVGPDHAGLTLLRMREWTSADIIKVEETSDSGNASVDNVLQPMIAGNSDKIGIYLHDDVATPKETTNAPLPYFPMQAFQTGADVYLPASNGPNGAITVTNQPRGDASKTQFIAVPNWPMDAHTIMLFFSDFPQ